MKCQHIFNASGPIASALAQTYLLRVSGKNILLRGHPMKDSQACYRGPKTDRDDLGAKQGMSRNLATIARERLGSNPGVSRQQ